LKTPEFLKKNPNAKFPILEISEGKYLYESGAILRYVARVDKSKGLYGTNIAEETQIDDWLDWSSRELQPTLMSMVGPFLGWQGATESLKDAEKKLRPLLEILEAHLKENKYMIGDKVTIADINIATYLSVPFRFLWDEKFREVIPYTTKWFQDLMSQEPFVKEFGKLVLCQKPLEFVALKKSKEEKKE